MSEAQSSKINCMQSASLASPTSSLSDTLSNAVEKLSQTVSSTVSQARATHSSSTDSIRLWMLIVAQLNPYDIEYSVADIAALLQMQPHALRHYCRRFWKVRDERYYYLSFEQAAILIYRVCRDAHRSKLPQVAELQQRLLDTSRITPNFPHDFPRIAHAHAAITRPVTSHS